MKCFKTLTKRGHPSLSEVYWALTPLWMVTWIEWDAFTRNAEGGLVEIYSGFHASFWNFWCLTGVFFLSDFKKMSRFFLFALSMVIVHMPWGSEKELWSVPFWILSFWIIKTALEQPIFYKSLPWVLGFELILGAKQMLTGTGLGLEMLGEPHLSRSISEIAHFRPYGTFPHPNLFGAWMALVAIGLKEQRKLTQGLSILGTFLSLSRSAILMLLTQLKSILWVPALVIIAIRTYISWGGEAFQRFAMWGEAWKILQKNPMGTGQGEYVHALLSQNPNLMPWEIQPVHNSFLLFISEWGILSIAWILFFWIEIRSSHKNMKILPALLIAGTLDHFWVSLPQGALLTALALALLTTPSQSHLLKIHQAP